MQRRDFFKLSLATCAVTLSASAKTTTKPIDTREVANISFPEKRPLITYSDRPPLLETPRDAFVNAITPNNEFFVRWHMSKIPTITNIDTFFLHVHGEVKNRLYLTMERLKKEFEPVEVTAVVQCGGNSRSAFHPTTSGIQWGSGAMGCATFKGARLKDILSRAGLKDDAVWLKLNGDDTAVMKKIESFTRELKISEISDDTIVAYEMNGEDIPYLNGYPFRLIIPGLYADSWVKMLSNIDVTKDYTPLYYMDTAYRVPDNECECETEEDRVLQTKPLEKMNVKSYIGYPTSSTQVHAGMNLTVTGVAFDSGHGIKKVQISLDGGKSWDDASLNDEISKYAFRVFKYKIKPMEKGSYTIMAKAINNRDEAQPFAHEIGWNHGGYRYNGIDSVTITVI